MEVEDAGGGGWGFHCAGTPMRRRRGQEVRRASLDGDCMVMMLATDMLSFLPFKMLITVTYRLSCRKMQHFLHFCLFQQVEDVERTAPAHETLRKESVPNLPGPIHIAVDRQGRLSSRTPSAAMPLSQLPNMKRKPVQPGGRRGAK